MQQDLNLLRDASRTLGADQQTLTSV